jgi:hypothetical protein
MPRTTVHIEEKAFLAMFLASAEAYPSRFRHDMHRRPNGTLPEGEAYGLLFGQKIFKDDDEMFKVTLAVPSQIVMNRHADGIEVHGVHFYRILELAEIFPAYQFLGTYHSHPYLEEDFNKKDSVDPSYSDRQTSLETADEVEKSIIDVIVGMTCLHERARMQPEFVSSHIIHHCSGSYLYSIGCSRSDFATKVYAPVDKLLCPVVGGVY